MGLKGKRVGVERVVAALGQSRGLITVAARILGCDPDSVRAYIRNHEVCRTAYNDAQDSMGDLAEGALYRAITDRDPWAVQFYLKTKQRHRGYGDRSEVDMTSTVQVQGQVRVDIDGFIAAVNAANTGRPGHTDPTEAPATVLPDA
jgi:hypothetical protein